MHGTRRRYLAAVVLGVAVLLAWGARGRARADEGDAEPAPAPAASACAECHSDAARAPGHVVDGARFARSAHKANACDDCHTGFEAFPHPKEGVETMGCVDCHGEEAKQVAASVHGRGPSPGSPIPRAAECRDCHGVHDVFPAKDPESRLWPLTVPATCGACHGGVRLHPNGNGNHKDVPPPATDRYVDDTHAHALLVSGLVGAPTCVTCHGGHDATRSSDPASLVHPAKVSETCGACHVGILAQYRQSIHGRTPRDASLTVNRKEPATCTDCHQPHRIRPVDEAFKVRVVETCMQCHEDRGKTYRGTYHGKITELGYGGVASCDECHTAHSILPSSDPASSVHASHRVATCSKCHEGATPAFAEYAVHANPEDREAWPVLYWGRTAMRTVILITWTLAGLHMVLWFQRAIRERKKHHAGRKDLAGRWYQRWPPFYRALHITVASTFLLLAVTGLPLKFHDSWWAAGVHDLLGGPVAVRFLHRLGGVVTFGYFFVYLFHLGRRIRRGEKGLFRGPVTMLPRWKDVQDIRANFRWFLKGGERPRFDRWTYWEKFDFWAEIWGVGFIGLTGLVMWFPIEATVVLPGWGINLAHVLHSYEALLATGFIFSVHFFHANLRPGKFPMDPIIFTGRISEEDLKEEHRAEYDRMKAEGRLETEALPPPDEALVRRAFWVGGILLSIGLLLLLFMLTTVVS